MTTATATTPNVAATIARQLGGTGRISAMVGAFNMLDHGDAFSFRFKARASGAICCKLSAASPSSARIAGFGVVEALAWFKAERARLADGDTCDKFGFRAAAREKSEAALAAAGVAL